jgi:hypothetical protein
MLEMGMLPPVVAGCSALMILMTSLASTLSFGESTLVVCMGGPILL